MHQLPFVKFCKVKVKKSPPTISPVSHGKVKVRKASPTRNHLLWKVKAQRDTIARMNANARNLELTEADLHGHAPEELACNQCGGAFCGSRAGRILDGKPLIMCGQKEEVKEILASIGRR